ncbi:MAG: hypothetical protein R3B40_12730 [Polyangiales bacterium]|nr:hypothetical protein [Myxococcales bacterium]
MTRTVQRHYRDPLDLVWTEVARRVGFRVERSDGCFASVDPAGVMTLGAPETLDADDCLAQMIFHELCHSLVQGREGLAEVDWGLDNESARDVPREHATLRLQAHLASQYGLRQVLAPTTDFRAFYDALPNDPWTGDPTEVALARAALALVDEAPWGPHLRDGLVATRAIADAVAPFTDTTALFHRE